MKKKGLIISTIVMVVVLVASLTTATYAWFSQSANAQIESIDVVTAASEGLQIAIYDTSSGDFTSGSTSLSTDTWIGGTGGWGESLSFDMSEVNFYAVSGDGQAMYSPDRDLETDEEDPVSENKIANTGRMKYATVNGEYFVANVALTNTKKTAGEVVISSLTITPTANSAGTTGIVDSMRIAVFARNEVEEDANTYDNTPTLQFVLNPYSNVNYNKSSRQFTVGTESEQTPYLVFSSFTDKTTTYASHTTSTFAAAKYIKGAKAATSGSPATLNATTGPSNSIEFTPTDSALLNFGSVDPQDVIYLQIVIWFEGEDVDSINAFAGGGARIAMNFGFAA